MSHMYAKPRAPRTVRGRLQTRYFFNQPLFCTVCIGTCAFSSFSLTVTFWDKVSINDNGIDPPSRIERAECDNERERERTTADEISNLFQLPLVYYCTAELLSTHSLSSHLEVGTVIHPWGKHKQLEQAGHQEERQHWHPAAVLLPASRTTRHSHAETTAQLRSLSNQPRQKSTYHKDGYTTGCHQKKPLLPRSFLCGPAR